MLEGLWGCVAGVAKPDRLLEDVARGTRTSRGNWGSTPEVAADPNWARWRQLNTSPNTCQHGCRDSASSYALSEATQHVDCSINSKMKTWALQLVVSEAGSGQGVGSVEDTTTSRETGDCLSSSQIHLLLLRSPCSTTATAFLRRTRSQLPSTKCLVSSQIYLL